ncbi:MAG: bifunctional hydroxymethylpyrimidine kinase/phosphomethylpyrimidine kinase [Armatimonadota bacterium]|nr:bifunctional hydroxymethylpyrimidine kinase/phosphomethylpyrimidine kinase [Armatimonadota bacterium]
MTTIPRALTIAGSDSGGGAGIQADLKTFSALGVFGMTAITALTAQNTTGVFGVVEIAPAFVAQQIDTVVTDIGVDAVKTGMLASAGIIEAVADRLRAHRLEVLVVDPVMIAKSGAPLLRPDAVEALRTLLLPLALVVTPNLHEARALTGQEIRTVREMEDAARRLHALGPRAVVVKGGHLAEAPVDVFYDGRRLVHLRAERIATPHTHGTGCVFASAIAAELAKGREVEEAVRRAKTFVTAAIRAALPLGRGHGPANPMHGQVQAVLDVS